MLSRALASIAAFSMLAHAMLGCCWHHSHADGGVNHTHAASCRQAAQLNVTSRTRHAHSSHGPHHSPSHGRQHHGDEMPIDETPPSPNPCDHDPCVYLAADRSASDLQLERQCLFSPVECSDSGQILTAHVVTSTATPRIAASAALRADLSIWQV